MKTARRHELQVNELSQQIEEIRTFLRKYGRQVAGVVTVVAAVVIGGYVYISGRNADIARGWADLYDIRSIANVPPTDQVQHYRAIADRNMTSMLTAMAVTRIGEISLAQSMDPTNSDSARQDWTKEAADAYQRVLREFDSMLIPSGIARLSLGLLDENRGDLKAAAERYQQIVDDARFRELPVHAQAEYRLKHLKDWSSAVEFPPPLPPASQPATTRAASTSMPDKKPVPPKRP